MNTFDQPDFWQYLLLGVILLVLFFFIRPGFKATLDASRNAENKDWKGFLIPLAAVALFVMLLIAMVR